MLESLRKGAGTWVAKIFIALLVLSFAVWGIADIFGNFGQQSLVDVGETKIDVQDYRSALQNQMRQLGQRTGRALTMEDARDAGLDRQVLFRLIGDAALESHGNDLKLGVSERHLANIIMNEPAFRGPSGRFDKVYFQQILSASGMTEQGYVASQRKANVRRQLMLTMTETLSVPKTMLEAINSYENEKRTLRYITVSAAKAGPIGTPSETDLKNFYEGRTQFYGAPEFRKLSLLTLDPEVMAKAVEVDPEDIKAFYEANKDSYLKAERRRIQQIAFTDKAAADAAHEKLKNGANFLAIALEQGLSERDIDLGLVAKKDLVDPAIADVAFKLQKGTYSTPVSGRLATAIIRVSAIEAEVVTPVESAKAEIRKRLARERAANDTLDLFDRIEDERAGGATLAEIAGKLSLTYREIEAIDAKGNDKTGRPVTGLTAEDKLLKAAFEGDVGIEMNPIETQSQGFIWIDVLKLIPARVMPLDEVADRVISDWRVRQTRTRLAEFCKALVARLNNGETLTALAQSLKLRVQQGAPVSRLQPSDQIPQAAIAQAFVLNQGEAGSASSPDGRARLVFEVIKVVPPAPLTDETGKKIEQDLETRLADDYFSQYLTGLRESYGVTINEAQVNQVTGRDR